MKLVRECICSLNELKVLRGPSEEETKKAEVKIPTEERLLNGAKYDNIKSVKRTLESEPAIHQSILDQTLLYASLNNNKDIVKLLLMYGADAHHFQDQILKVARWRNFKGVVKVIEDHLAKEEKKVVKESVNERFTQDSDPISDMGLGFKTQAKKFCRFLEKELRWNNAHVEINHYEQYFFYKCIPGMSFVYNCLPGKSIIQDIKNAARVFGWDVIVNIADPNSRTYDDGADRHYYLIRLKKKYMLK